jgi:hypothetical protein
MELRKNSLSELVSQEFTSNPKPTSSGKRGKPELVGLELSLD